MKIDNIIKYTRRKTGMLFAVLMSALLIPCFSSCVLDTLYYDDGACDGEEITVPISLFVQPIQSVNPETRATDYIEATDDEKEIHDFWIIQYHENGTRAGLPRYFTKGPDVAGTTYELPTSIPILVPREGRDEDHYTCVLIANSNDPTLFSQENTALYNTLDKLRSFDLPTHNHEHVFDPEHHKYLLMSGWTEITTDPSTHNLKFDLIRNVCKVNVQLTAFDVEDLAYKYFQWRDVPLGKAFPHGAVNYKQIVSRDWRMHMQNDPYEELKLKDLKEGIDFYIPCNVWLPEGPTPNSMGEDKNTRSEVTEDPTHFTIVCREIDEEGNESADMYEFCLYPSKDVNKQFDFKTNHYYELKMAINGVPDPETDPFFNILHYVELPESNCYMMRRDSKDLFAVPISRINTYWDAMDDSESIGDDDEWVAEVIWQDTPTRILDFVSYREFEVDDDKARLQARGATYTDDNGNEGDMCFAFRTTGSGVGNVIIGVRKKVVGWEDIPVEKREYLWSWHIWISEYDPCFNKPSWIRKSAQVLNGKVHYIKGMDPESDGYFMDRNLGAVDCTPPPYSEPEFNSDGTFNMFPKIEEIVKRLPTFGLYYQYGRKDPFPFPEPHAQGVYNIYGLPIKAFMSQKSIDIGNHSKEPIITMLATDYRDGTLGSFNESVKRPYLFFTRREGGDGELYEKTIGQDEGGNDITTEVIVTSWWDYGGEDFTLGAGSIWADPGLGDSGTKSFFDPCPPGWMVADGSLFKEFASRDYEQVDDEGHSKTVNGPIQPGVGLDWSGSERVGRLVGVFLTDYYDIVNVGEPGFNFGDAKTYKFEDPSNYPGYDQNLKIWFPGQSVRFNDQASGLLFMGEGETDYANAIWLNNENALKFTIYDVSLPSPDHMPNMASGYPIRCQRDLSYEFPDTETRSGKRSAARASARTKTRSAARPRRPANNSASRSALRNLSRRPRR